MNLWSTWLAHVPALLERSSGAKKPAVREIPNQFNQVRREGIVVVGAIVHSMAEYVKNDSDRWGPVGEFPAHEWLQLKNWSAHAFIQPDGTIIAAVDIDRVAFHAGKSRWEDLTDGLPSESLNYNMLGAEWLVEGAHDYGSFLEHIGDSACYTDDQYNAGGWLYAMWQSVCPHYETEYILAHSAVAGDDVRGEGKGKPDPGDGFSWHKFRESFQDWAQTIQR